ncbi:MAG: ABC transporter ATP-binding protein [Candidatus Sumerlaeota bacterium]|nr:ABC transporter ATP-binding protein [Candidatus Sumerlaeota bacterium]
MNKNVAIHVEGLGKLYQIGGSIDLTLTFREALYSLPRAIAQKTAHGIHKLFHPSSTSNPQPAIAILSSPVLSPETENRKPKTALPSAPPGMFWALRDINFEVQRGEAIGIIGRNGAGKSTLLKILARITSPTTGEAEIRGRVGSLLEVGTGFHPELTGRENIYLNGSILGMRKSEIDRCFDEIVAFAETGQFLDMPVKRYSSGMRVRLAFAVAAHIKPEILIIDEVLAVGDAQFQKKCLGKMGEVAQGDRTVLFVSHDMGAIAGLCTKCIYLKDGMIEDIGPTQDVIFHYLSDFKADSPLSFSQRRDRGGDGRVRLTQINFFDAKTRAPLDAVLSGQDVLIEIGYEASDPSLERIGFFNIGLAFFTNLGQFVMVLNSQMANRAFQDLPPRGAVYCRVPRFPLMTGAFFVSATLQVNGQLADQVREALICHVETGDYFNTGITNVQGRQGVYVDHCWLRDPGESDAKGKVE